MITTLRFQHPGNQHVETIQSPALWTFFIGPIYMAIHGAWGPAVWLAFLGLLTGGISWIFVPFFAAGLLRRHFLMKGWTELPPLEKAAKHTKLGKVVVEKDYVSGDIWDAAFQPMVMGLCICSAVLLAAIAWMKWGV